VVRVLRLRFRFSWTLKRELKEPEIVNGEGLGRIAVSGYSSCGVVESCLAELLFCGRLGDN
jgi:hypothetical protein